MSSYAATIGQSAGGMMGRQIRVVTRTLTTNENQSDEDLVSRVAKADRDALACLLDRHSDRAYAFATRLLGNPTEAEDAVQEAFLKLWREAGRWRAERGRFAPWFFRIVYNLCIDVIRRRRTVALDVVAEMASDEPSPEDVTARRLRDDRVAAALEGLPERQRAAVLLCYYQGLSNREAAEVMEVGVKGLEALLVRARRQLAQTLASEREQKNERDRRR